MRVVVTSDFHGRFPEETPACDLLILAGDCLPVLGSTRSEATVSRAYREFEMWLADQPARHIVGIAGNHDFDALHNDAYIRDLPWTYLNNQEAVVDGMTIFGSPYSMPFGQWAFMAPDEKLAEIWAIIPDDCDILVTHGPAYGIRDLSDWGREHTGSRSLTERIKELSHLKLHAFGHIHECYGSTTWQTGANGAVRTVVSVNGAHLRFSAGKNNPPIEVIL